MPVRRGNPGENRRILVNKLLHIRGIYRDQILQRRQNPHAAVFNDFRIVKLCPHENIRVLVAGPHQALFLIIALRRKHVRKVQIDVGHLLILFPHPHGIPLGLYRALLSEYPERDLFVHNRKALGIHIPCLGAFFAAFAALCLLCFSCRVFFCCGIRRLACLICRGLTAAA